MLHTILLCIVFVSMEILRKNGGFCPKICDFRLETVGSEEEKLFEAFNHFFRFF